MKLMEKMGWEKGKGIGKDLQGRAVPVEATVRKGKAAVGMYGPESKEVRLKQQQEQYEKEENDDEGYRHSSHVSQWKKSKNKKVNYNAITPDQLLEMAANNPKKLKKIEQMLDLSDTKSKQSDTVSGLKTSKIKIIDMTGKEQRVMHGYESISQMNKRSYLASEKKQVKQFDLPELTHNLELLVNLTENKILNFDKKLKHTEDTIVNLQYEEKESKERVKVECEQIEKLKILLELIEECELSVKKENVTIEELIDQFQSLQTNYADEFIIFNLMELAIPLLVPVIKRK
jgi:tuftelin-interacting protein 11